MLIGVPSCDVIAGLILILIYGIHMPKMGDHIFPLSLPSVKKSSWDPSEFRERPRQFGRRGQHIYQSPALERKTPAKKATSFIDFKQAGLIYPPNNAKSNSIEVLDMLDLATFGEDVLAKEIDYESSSDSDASSFKGSKLLRRSSSEPKINMVNSSPYEGVDLHPVPGNNRQWW